MPEQTRNRRALPLRRLLAVCIGVAFLAGMFWLLFLSGLTDPLFDAVTSGYEHASALINDPLGIDWGGYLVAAAAIVIPLGIVLVILDG